MLLFNLVCTIGFVMSFLIDNIVAIAVDSFVDLKRHQEYPMKTNTYHNPKYIQLSLYTDLKDYS